jgi:hypothetical protein
MESAVKFRVGGLAMHELTTTPAGLPASALRSDGSEPPPSKPFQVAVSPALAVRLSTHDKLDEKLSWGEFDQFRGEYILAHPDGTFLAHTDSERGETLLAARGRTREKAAEMGLPPEHVTTYYVPPLD